MNTTILPVQTKKELKEFIRLPWKIYKGNPNWVPPLISELKKTFNKEKYPFFEHSDAEFFLAKRNGETVGRIAAIKNNNHLKIYNDDLGFFGFFESINDQGVANGLFNEAVQWLKNHGLKKIRGPENYSQNEEIGLLIDAFDTPPVIMMPYNPPYYKTLVESAGFEKAIDLYAYQVESSGDIPERLQKSVGKLKQCYNFNIRKINLKKIDEEIEKIKVVYNSAWAENWGAVPFTDTELNAIKNDLLKIANPDIVFLAEINGEPVGVSVAVPDINEALIKINGRLFPLGMFKFLYFMRNIKGVRVLIMGVLKEHRNKGIDIAFYYETFKNGLRHGFVKGEMSWILENNYAMRNAAEKIPLTRHYKTYRLYEKEID